MIRLAVFGLPVAHSLSPAIHRQFGRQCGLAVDYRAIEASAADFDARLRELIAAGGRGCNVTVPLKRQAWQFAHRSSPQASKAEAANTLVFERPDDCVAHNTDGRGLLQDLARCMAAPIAGNRILVLGAGGAAAGILGDLLLESPAEIVLANRNLERAQKLQGRFASMGRLSCSAFDGLNRVQTFDLVINATSMGHLGLCPDLSVALFTARGMCYDLNYGRAAAPLRAWCKAAGISYRDGLGMLVEQAAASFELWTGVLPGSEPVLQQLRRDFPEA